MKSSLHRISNSGQGLNLLPVLAIHGRVAVGFVERIIVQQISVIAIRVDVVIKAGQRYRLSCGCLVHGLLLDRINRLGLHAI